MNAILYMFIYINSIFLKALAGEIGMNSILDNVASSLYNGQLPDEWRKYAPATCKTLGGWMQHFEKRNEQYHSWVSVYFHEFHCTSTGINEPNHYFPTYF